MHLDFMLALLIYYAHPLSVPNGFDAPQLGYQMEPLDKPAKLRVRITVAAEVATRVACSCIPSVVASPCCCLNLLLLLQLSLLLPFPGILIDLLMVSVMD